MKLIRKAFLPTVLIAAGALIPAYGQDGVTAINANADASPKFGSVESGPVVPHFAAGVGFSTEFQFFSLEEFPVDVDVFVIGDDGQEMQVAFRSQNDVLFEATDFTVTLPPRGEVRTVAILNQPPDVFGSELRSGAVLLQPSNPAANVGVTAVITYHNAQGAPIYRTSVPGMAEFEPHMRMPFTNTDGLTAGIGITNFLPRNATLIARNGFGMELCRATIPFASAGHRADFLVNILPCTADTSGLLDIVTTTTPGSGEGLAAVGLTFDPSIRMWTQVPYSVRRGVIRAVANTNKCIHKKDIGFANENPIHLWDCDSQAPETVENQTWFFEPATGYIRNGVNPSKCIHKVDDDFDDGNLMHLFDCDVQGDDADRNKIWIYEDRTGFIRNARRPDKCIQRKDSDFDNGNRLELEDCGADNVERRTWIIEQRR